MSIFYETTICEIYYTLSANYKIPELYNIFESNEGYEKYIKDLYAVSNEYVNRAIALSALHIEAFIRSMKKQEAFDPANTMCQMFDCMSEEDQKRFCDGILQKKEFFKDAYESMMNSFQNAMKINQKEKA